MRSDTAIWHDLPAVLARRSFPGSAQRGRHIRRAAPAPVRGAERHHLHDRCQRNARVDPLRAWSDAHQPARHAVSPERVQLRLQLQRERPGGPERSSLLCPRAPLHRRLAAWHFRQLHFQLRRRVMRRHPAASDTCGRAVVQRNDGIRPGHVLCGGERCVGCRPGAALHLRYFRIPNHSDASHASRRGALPDAVAAHLRRRPGALRASRDVQRRLRRRGARRRRRRPARPVRAAPLGDRRRIVHPRRHGTGVAHARRRRRESGACLDASGSFETGEQKLTPSPPR